MSETKEVIVGIQDFDDPCPSCKEYAVLFIQAAIVAPAPDGDEIVDTVVYTECENCGHYDDES